MQFYQIAISIFLFRIFITNAQNSFIQFASESNEKVGSEIGQYKLQNMNQKLVEKNPEKDFVYRYHGPPAADLHQAETSVKYPDSVTNNSSSETTTMRQPMVILKMPFEGKEPAIYLYPRAAFVNPSPPDGKGHATYFYPNAAYTHPPTEGPFTTTTTTATADGSRSFDTAKQANNPPITIGDIFSVQRTNAIIMTIINAVTLGLIWLGGEVSWVGRSSFSSHFGPEVNKWLLRSVSLNEDEHAGALQSMCVQRAACEAPRAALLYLDTKGHLTRLLSYFTHLSLDPTGSISEGFLRGGANAGMRKLNCEHLFPCYDFTQH